MGKRRAYQKAVNVAKPEAETIIPIEAAAQENWPILSNKPLTDPGLPSGTFIALYFLGNEARNEIEEEDPSNKQKGPF